jgi:hypothetical protein
MLVLAPVIATPFFFHWKFKPPPLASTLNDALSPAHAIASIGDVVTTGAVLTTK